MGYILVVCKYFVKVKGNFLLSYFRIDTFEEEAQTLESPLGNCKSCSGKENMGLAWG